jgi:hypothetical protein
MLIRVLLICVGVLLVAQTRAYAYADPGSGTLIWQMVLAASFGVMFYARRIIRWFRGLKPGQEKGKTPGAETEKESESVKG